MIRHAVRRFKLSKCLYQCSVPEEIAKGFARRGFKLTGQGHYTTTSITPVTALPQLALAHWQGGVRSIQYSLAAAKEQNRNQNTFAVPQKIMLHGTGPL